MVQSDKKHGHVQMPLSVSATSLLLQQNAAQHPQVLSAAVQLLSLLLKSRLPDAYAGGEVCALLASASTNWPADKRYVALRLRVVSMPSALLGCVSSACLVALTCWALPGGCAGNGAALASAVPVLALLLAGPAALPQGGSSVPAPEPSTESLAMQLDALHLLLLILTVPLPQVSIAHASASHTTCQWCPAIGLDTTALSAGACLSAAPMERVMAGCTEDAARLPGTACRSAGPSLGPAEGHAPDFSNMA